MFVTHLVYATHFLGIDATLVSWNSHFMEPIINWVSLLICWLLMEVYFSPSFSFQTAVNWLCLPVSFVGLLKWAISLTLVFLTGPQLVMVCFPHLSLLFHTALGFPVFCFADPQCFAHSKCSLNIWGPRDCWKNELMAELTKGETHEWMYLVPREVGGWEAESSRATSLLLYDWHVNVLFCMCCSCVLRNIRRRARNIRMGPFQLWCFRKDSGPEHVCYVE